MSYANGQLPASALAPIPGTSTRPGGRPLLRRDCAALYNDMARHSPVSLALHETAIRRAYREYSAQVLARSYWCGLGKCYNAALPGTSRHGLGINGDLETCYQRSWVDAHGEKWGWSKRWSDAPNEWWHVTCDPARARVHPAQGWPTVRYGCRGPAVKKLQQLLRGRHRYRIGVADGVFGRQTRSAVIAFQRRNHLHADGVVGPATWHILLRR